MIAFLVVGILIGSALSSLGDASGPNPVEAEPGSPSAPSTSESPSPSRSPSPSPSPSPTPEPDGTNALVTRVIDGDTVEADFGGEGIKVRLIGVDTPETVAPSEPVECYGPAASKFTRNALEGETIRLEFDIERLDRYGRTLAYVWLGRQLFNEQLVEEGFANVSTFPPNVKYVDRFLAAQRDARSHDRGLWGRCVEEPTPSSSPSPDPSGCTSGYSPCLPPGPFDYDCSGGEGNGPAYTDPGVTYQVTGSDPYGLDADGDGAGCE